MQKLIWASLDDYLPPGDSFQHVGRNIANHSFFQALLRYGHFDEYHLFLANSAHRRLFKAGRGQSYGLSRCCEIASLRSQ